MQQKGKFPKVDQEGRRVDIGNNKVEKEWWESPRKMKFGGVGEERSRNICTDEKTRGYFHLESM